MKTTLLMAITVNGYIAGPNDDTEWIKNFDSLYKTIAEFGIIAMGKRTYDECVKYDVFPYKGAVNIVMTHDKDLLAKSSSKEIFTDNSPSEVVQLVQDKDFDQLLIIGGGQINGAFLKAGLVDEIVLDIHPIIIARGIKLFASKFKDVNLELVNYELVNKLYLRVKYQVKR